MDWMFYKENIMYIKKISFLCCLELSRTGGSEKLIPAEGTNSAKVEGVGKMLKKVKSESYLECSAKSPIKKLFNNAILKKNSSRLPYIAVGQSELSAVSESTNQKPGRSQGLEGGEYKRGGQC